MRTIAFAALVAVFALGSAIGTAVAEDTCQSKAIGKDGRPLAGAALNSFMADQALSREPFTALGFLCARGLPSHPIGTAPSSTYLWWRSKVDQFAASFGSALQQPALLCCGLGIRR